MVKRNPQPKSKKTPQPAPESSDQTPPVKRGPGRPKGPPPTPEQIEARKERNRLLGKARRARKALGLQPDKEAIAKIRKPGKSQVSNQRAAKIFSKEQVAAMRVERPLTLVDLAEISDQEDWSKASPIEQMFCYEYFTRGFNLLAAFKAVAGADGHGDLEEVEKRAQMFANRMKVVRALKVLVDYFLQDRKVALAPKILEVLEAQAFYDIANIVDSNGELKCKLSELSYKDRLCIKSIETRYYGKDADVSATVVTLVDRNQALEKLARFIALFHDVGNVSVSLTQNNLTIPPSSDSKARLGAIFQAASSFKITNVPSLEG